MSIYCRRVYYDSDWPGQALLSQYHFIRIYLRATTSLPKIHRKISESTFDLKYMLKNTSLSVGMCLAWYPGFSEEGEAFDCTF